MPPPKESTAVRFGPLWHGESGCNQQRNWIREVLQPFTSLTHDGNFTNYFSCVLGVAQTTKCCVTKQPVVCSFGNRNLRNELRR